MIAKTHGDNQSVGLWIVNSVESPCAAFSVVHIFIDDVPDASWNLLVFVQRLTRREPSYNRELSNSCCSDEGMGPGAGGNLIPEKGQDEGKTLYVC